MNVDAFKFLSPRLWPDLFEILLVSFVVYRFLLFLVGTRALQIVIGLVILSLTYFVAVFAKFTMISTLLGVIFTYGAFAAVVVFQPELRNALARLGQSRFMRAFSRGDRQSVAEEIAEALDRLSRASTGAIIAVEGDIGLEEFITTGVPMEAKGSADLLTTIFTPAPFRIAGAASACPSLPPKPPSREAAAVVLLVLIGYVITLAPTVTWWDAGKFITAAKVLGVPHPPGTPLFVLLGHVWAGVVRIGGYAWRLNLMSACFSASGAGCLFLVAHRLLQGEAQWLRIGGAAAAALLAAFPFTHWQNSNETEVYAVATFSIAAICWLGVRWRDLRGTARAPHILLLIVYIAALSIGNHLLALLVGPALSLFMLYTLRALPAADPAERQMEWAEWGALTAVWIVLVAVGLGSTPLIIAGGALLAACVVLSVMGGSWAFPDMAIGIAVVGIF